MQSPGHVAHGRASAAGSAAISESPNLLLRDFLQERWKGLTPILWARQLKQERLDELIYLSLMNADHLPVDDLVSPMSDFYRFDTTPGGRKPEDDSDQSDSAANKGATDA